MGVGDDELDPRQPPGHERAQEGRPGRGVLGGDDVEADDLAPALGVDGGGDDRRDVHHPAALAHLLGEGVDPQVAIGALVQGALPELGHHGVELGGEAGHLGLGDPLDADGLDQVVDPPGRHPGHVGLADHRHERLLGPAPGLEQELGRVDPPAELGHRQVLDRADPGVPRPGADTRSCEFVRSSVRSP